MMNQKEKFAQLKESAEQLAKERKHTLKAWDTNLPFDDKKGERVISKTSCERCGKEVAIDTNPSPNGIDVFGEVLALNCGYVIDMILEDLLDTTQRESEPKIDQLERLLRSGSEINDMAELTGADCHILAVLLDDMLEEIRVEEEQKRHCEIIESGDKTELEQGYPSTTLISGARTTVGEFTKRFLTLEYQRDGFLDVLNKQSPHWTASILFPMDELFELAGLNKYRVKYSEKRSYDIIVAAEDSDDAREVADNIVYNEPNAHWHYSCEEYDVVDDGSWYDVAVGNIGQVYSGDSLKLANEKFDHYVSASKKIGSRASGEDVTMFKDGDLMRDYLGVNSSMPKRI